MELTRAVGENIKRIRKGKKLSMERLAAEAGVSRSMLGQIERGEANPSVAILGKLAGALKVPAEVLLENDDFEPLLLLRELDNKPARLDGGKALLRPSLPYDDVLPAGEYARLYYRGEYDRMEEHMGTLLAGIRAAGRAPEGAPLELYRIDAHDTNHPEEYVTELQVRLCTL